MSTLITVLHVIVCLFLMLTVLLQSGKGGGMAAFGGGGTETAFGARAGATLLTRATTILAALFMVISLVLGIMWRTGGGSVVSGVGGPAPAPAAQTPAPQQPQ